VLTSWLAGAEAAGAPEDVFDEGLCASPLAVVAFRSALSLFVDSGRGTASLLPDSEVSIGPPVGFWLGIWGFCPSDIASVLLYEGET
jgi:hypothetical protein